MHFVKLSRGVASQAFDGKCRSYEPGHSPHYIQLRKASESSRVEAKFVGVELPSKVCLSIEGVIIPFSNHHPDIIRDLITIHEDGELYWVEEFRVLVLETKNTGGFAFNLTKKALDSCQP